ncbi:hypothetical protein O9G_004911 [Rozella allomycis CSF55]|uniref:Cation/H+ exchanger transmembrane domain-containing protein n=1 Tax=Rozella allomycis (strain CSF55) TaxID=988480 RepID=A0A075AMW0_ROZAC|nr:hypothetical protein O9G_004911 [Rozella allomycis CSF55]|eukprot:EPZ31059.1 hypothetical protein O9G_004911 [Rozella allomycis CSF55]
MNYINPERIPKSASAQLFYDRLHRTEFMIHHLNFSYHEKTFDLLNEFSSSLKNFHVRLSNKFSQSYGDIGNYILQNYTKQDFIPNLNNQAREIAKVFIDECQHTVLTVNEFLQDETLSNNESSKNKTNSMVDNVIKNVAVAANDLEKSLNDQSFKKKQNEKGTTLETVIKIKEEEEIKKQGSQGNLASTILIDNANNQYVLAKPSDITILYADPRFLQELVAVSITSFVLSWLIERIHLPGFLGYICAGILLGPAGLNYIKNLIQFGTISQLGVLFMIFFLGLEFELDRLKQIWHVSVLGGIAFMLYK